MASTLATIGFKEALGSAKLPPMTVPFCTVALEAYLREASRLYDSLVLVACSLRSGCFLLGGRVPGLVHAARPHSPEMNLHAYHHF